MLNYIKGTIVDVNGSNIILESNSIGYEIKTPNASNFKLNSEIIVYTYLHVKEDMIELYGFKCKEEKNFFCQLISVKGLGPKSALAILASSEINKTVDAINSGNFKYLQQFPGIGIKASQQIILDLRGKINLNSNLKTTNPKIESIKNALK